MRRLEALLTLTGFLSGCNLMPLPARLEATTLRISSSNPLLSEIEIETERGRERERERERGREGGREGGRGERERGREGGRGRERGEKAPEGGAAEEEGHEDGKSVLDVHKQVQSKPINDTPGPPCEHGKQRTPVELLDPLFQSGALDILKGNGRSYESHITNDLPAYCPLLVLDDLIACFPDSLVAA